MKHVGIIGGGVIGMFTAWYLQRAGHKVTIIDKGDLLSGCSFGNAGMIVPSHFVPLAAPGMISKGVRWMFNPESPFYVRLSLRSDLLKWGWTFYRSATNKNVAAAAPALMNLSLLSKKCYQQVAKEIPFDLFERGLLMLYQRTATGAEEMETVEMAHKLGMEAKVLSSSDVQLMEPNIKVTALGGIYFPGDAHLSPSVLMTRLREHLIQRGVQLLADLSVTDFEKQGGLVKSVITDKGKHVFDEVVIAAGAWSPGVAQKLGLGIPMQPGKGYSFTLKGVKQNVTIPTIFLEDRVAVTPMGNDLRFGGTMEIGGIGGAINMRRVKGIVDAIPRYYPEIEVSMPEKRDVWSGLRPCSPDGLPFIGRPKSFTNLTIATGHGMMGVSLAPGTGKLVADVIDAKPTGVDLGLFAPDRFR